MQALLSPTLRLSPFDPLRKQSPSLSSSAAPSKRASFVKASALPQREKDPKKRVVITGTGVVSVFGNDPDVFYDKLLEGVSGVVPIDRFDASKFPTRFAAQIRNFSSEGYIDGKNDRRLDDCLRYCLVAGKKALESADLGGEKLSKIDKIRAGVLVGTGMGGLTVFSDGVQALIEKGHRKITPFFIPYSITNMASALLAIDLGLMGPNYSISTACATSNYCFYSAANHIRRGEADMMIAGGTEAAIIPIGLGGFVACRALSQRNDEPQTASRPWDKDRDGFVMGEGAGVLVRESLEHAMKRGAPIIAEFLGGAVNCDAYHMTDPRADGLGVSSCIENALEDGGVSPEEVNYINAHATSTIVGDLAEVNAIKKVFKNTSGIKDEFNQVYDRALSWCCWGFGSHCYCESCDSRVAASNHKSIYCLRKPLRCCISSIQSSYNLNRIIQQPSSGNAVKNDRKPGKKEHHLWKRRDAAGSGQKALNLVRIVSGLPNEKEAVYRALDEWTAWELEFPLIAAAKALSTLRKRSQWLRVIQVAKWMLSKGQGTTMATYDTLLLAFDHEARIDEAGSLWNMILHTHTRSISKRLFSRMMSLYDHHHIPEKIIEVFADMEELGVKPDEDTVRRVARAFEKLGQEDKKKLVLQRYGCKWKYIHFKGERVKVKREPYDE